MNRREYYNKVFSHQSLYNLQEIKTMPELQKYIGKVLIFANGCNIVWIGILKKETFDNINNLRGLIHEKRIYMNDTFFIYRLGNFLNIFSIDLHNSSNIEKIDFVNNDNCDAQNKILIPDSRMLVYYNFGRMLLPTLQYYNDKI